jgi:hypothetical protein
VRAAYPRGADHDRIAPGRAAQRDGAWGPRGKRPPVNARRPRNLHGRVLLGCFAHGNRGRAPGHSSYASSAGGPTGHSCIDAPRSSWQGPGNRGETQADRTEHRMHPTAGGREQVAENPAGLVVPGLGLRELGLGSGVMTGPPPVGRPITPVAVEVSASTTGGAPVSRRRWVTPGPPSRCSGQASPSDSQLIRRSSTKSPTPTRCALSPSIGDVSTERVKTVTIRYPDPAAPEPCPVLAWAGRRGQSRSAR